MERPLYDKINITTSGQIGLITILLLKKEINELIFFENKKNKKRVGSETHR